MNPDFILYLIDVLAEEVEYAYFEHRLDEIPPHHFATQRHLNSLMETQPC